MVTSKESVLSQLCRIETFKCNPTIQANVLVSDEGRALLCDWGQISLATYTECDNHGKTTTILQRHHRHWMAFEVFYENDPALFLSKPADVWAFAMVVIEVRGNIDKDSFIVLTDGKMFTNSEPFGKRTLMEVYFEHKAKRRPQRPESEECDDALWELVCSCWHDDPEERPTAEEVKNRIRPTTSIVEPKSVCVSYFCDTPSAYTTEPQSFLRRLGLYLIRMQATTAHRSRKFVSGWTYRWIRAFISSLFDRFRKSPRFSR